MTAAVIVSLRIAASPQDCFDAFVDDISLWWKPNGLFQLTPRGDGELRFEPGENGRLVTTLSNGHVFEIKPYTVMPPSEIPAPPMWSASMSPRSGPEAPGALRRSSCVMTKLTSAG